MVNNIMTFIHNGIVWLRISLMVWGVVALALVIYHGWNMGLNVTNLDVSMYRTK